jgi:restriction system protein
VVEIVARIMKVSDSERKERVKSGGLRFDKNIAFARKYLSWAGYLDGSTRGVWTLTEKGLAAPGLTNEEALELFKEQHALHSISAEEGTGAHTG